MLTKICKVCSTEKALSLFYKNPGGKYGVRATCTVCEEEKRKTVYKPKEQKTLLAYAQKYREANYAICLERTRNWRRNNLKYDAFRARTYRARKQQQLPTWASIEKIKQIYLACPEGYHVDHIIPLKGIKACGLHIESNLQYLPAKENLSKRNLYGWDDE